MYISFTLRDPQLLLELFCVLPKNQTLQHLYLKSVFSVKMIYILFVFIIRCSMGLKILGFTGTDRHYNAIKCWHYFSFNCGNRQTCLSNEWNEQMNESNLQEEIAVFIFVYVSDFRPPPPTRCCPYLGGCWKIAELII